MWWTAKAQAQQNTGHWLVFAALDHTLRLNDNLARETKAMLRSIHEECLNAFGRSRRPRPAPRHSPPVGVKMWTEKTVDDRHPDVQRHSDGNFAAPHLPVATYRLAAPARPTTSSLERRIRFAPSSSPWQFSGIAGVSQRQRLHRRRSQRPRRPPGRLPQRQRQHQPNRLLWTPASTTFRSLAAQRLNYQTQNQESRS